MSQDRALAGVDALEASLFRLYTAAAKGVFVCDSDGRILSCNEVCRSSAGLDVGDLVELAPGSAQLDWVDRLRLASNGEGRVARFVSELPRPADSEPGTMLRFCLHHDVAQDVWVATFEPEGLGDRIDSGSGALPDSVSDSAPGTVPEPSSDALLDPLTGLLNRRGFLAELNSRLVQSREGTAVAFLDVDDFKTVNDAFGHAMGDAFLTELGQRISEAVRPDDAIGRLGGDEFVVAFHAGSADSAKAVADRIANLCHAQAEFDGITFRPGVSVGVAIASASSDVDSLLADADLAMYEAKLGERRVVVADEDTRIRGRRTLAASRDLLPALERNEVGFLYRPICHLASGEVLGLEGEMRWDHPEYGPISQELIRQTAEGAGHLRQLTEWSLEASAADLATLRRRIPDYHDKAVALQLTANQLSLDGVVESCLATLDHHGLRTVDRVIHVEESTLAKTYERAARAWKQLSNAGVILCLDGFGSGHKSLAYLTEFEVAALILHQPLFRAAVASEPGRIVLRGVKEICEQLGIELLAEGVDSRSDLRFCVDFGIEIGRGRITGPALPAAAIEHSWVATNVEAQGPPPSRTQRPELDLEPGALSDANRIGEFNN